MSGVSARRTQENLARRAAAGTRPLPVNDVVWGGVVRRWQTELGLPADATPRAHFDLDWIVTIPNMDPHIRPIDIVRETPEKVVVRTGFETTLQKIFELPMPEPVDWATDMLEQLEAFEFDPPNGPRRFVSGRQSHRRWRRRLRTEFMPLNRDRALAARSLCRVRQHDAGLGVPNAARGPHERAPIVCGRARALRARGEMDRRILCRVRGGRDVSR